MYDWKRLAEHQAETRRRALDTPGPDGGPVVFQSKYDGDGEFSVSGNRFSFCGFFSSISADNFAKQLTEEHAERWGRKEG